MSKLSVVINTKNSAQTIQKALKSVKWADQVVVVDMHSSDDTLSIAKKYTSDIFEYPDVGYVEPARNFAISKAKYEWVLILDSDEEVPKTLADKITALIAGDATADAYSIPRKNLVFGVWHIQAGGWPDYQLRLFKKGSVVWSNVIHSIPTVSGTSDKLAPVESMAIIHYHYNSIGQYIERLNSYTDFELESKSSDMVTSPGVIEAFEQEFLRRLFEQKGIDGGIHGISLSFLQSLYQVVVVLKQWEQQGFPDRRKEERVSIEALRNFQTHLNYWIASWQIEHTSGLSKWWWKLRRKFMR